MEKMKMNSDKCGIGLLEILTIIFIVLKLCGQIDWSWWWVFAPIWIPISIGILIGIFIFWIKGWTGKNK